jgi:hypothetical protein
LSTAARIRRWFSGFRASSYSFLATPIAAALLNSFMATGLPVGTKRLGGRPADVLSEQLQVAGP